MYCSNCGQGLKGYEKFCKSCGAAIHINRTAEGLTIGSAHGIRRRGSRYVGPLIGGIVAVAVIVAICVALTPLGIIGDESSDSDARLRQELSQSGGDATEVARGKADDPAGNESLESAINNGKQSTMDGLAELMAVKINGTDYHLPNTVKDFTDDGWVVGTTDEAIKKPVKAGSYDMPSFYLNAKREEAISPIVVNRNESDDLPTEECPVMGIGFSAPSENIAFELRSGLSHGSTYDDFKRQYGDPSQFNESDNGMGHGVKNIGVITATWEFKADESRVVYVGQFFEDRGEGNGFFLNYFTMVHEPDGFEIW